MMVGALIRQSGLSTLEARALLACTLNVTRETLVAHPEVVVAEADVARFDALVGRRKAGEPLAYLLEEREFFGRAYRVTPDVLIPRPETELLVEQLLLHAQALIRPRVLDLGTGSGCIAISIALERPDAEVTAVDRSPHALDLAKANAARLGARVAFLESDWYSAVSGQFELIAANPPYVAAGDPHLGALGYEPRSALVAPDGGLACLRSIIGDARKHLSMNGMLFVEHGHDQAIAVRNLFVAAGFGEVRAWRDHAQIERLTAGRSASAG